MNTQNRTGLLWLTRSLGGLLLTAVVLIGGAGQAFADDDEVKAYGPNACSVVAGLPVYPSAVCVKHEHEVDDGVLKTENTYLANGAADTGAAVQSYFETTFRQNGWTVIKIKHDVADQEWKYTAVQGQRRIQVEIEVLEPDEGIGTAITIEEK